MILPIFTIPDPILKKKSVEIKKFDQESSSFVLDMVETLRKNKGVGLAAPQVGKNIRLVVIEFDPKKFKDESHEDIKGIKPIPLTVLINPKIISRSKETEKNIESCLSCPDVEVEILRYTNIKVLAQSLDGNRIKIKAKDYFARILQHEIDHLDGILITDKVKTIKK